ncbi:MAG: hypothetical protein ABFQ95_05990 [Pseudomonadota bacterium]
MTNFQETNNQIKSEVMLRLMESVEHSPKVSQRKRASELGVAMGLVNSYLKRAITKGWIRAKEVPAHRYAYYLTPQGLAEKGQLATEYLTSSFTFFRSARGQCLDLFAECEQKGWSKIALVGNGELAEIAELVAMQSSLDVGRVAPKILSDKGFDAVMLVDIQNPQEIYETLCGTWTKERILTPALLYVSRDRQQQEK